jgi:hypothetical protein
MLMAIKHCIDLQHTVNKRQRQLRVIFTHPLTARMAKATAHAKFGNTALSRFQHLLLLIELGSESACWEKLTSSCLTFLKA